MQVRTRQRALTPLIKSVALAVLVSVVVGVPGAPVEAASLRASQGAATSRATPGSFYGFGFDQCLAPTQTAMDRWLESSPYLAVGIYISGDSRGCRSQPNLTPTWVATQLSQGWKLLPITLGPQASCQGSFPRYGTDATINPASAGGYAAARDQGLAEASKSVAVAQGLGIAAGSTLWYDLEGFSTSSTDCRESALSFLGGWTEQLHALGYVSGVYSSAGSGIQQLDQARLTRPTRFALPDQIWIARWDGAANTSTTYIGEDGWRPGGRMKQYLGGHQETWGGQTINVDSNYLELGAAPVPKAMTQCGTQVEFASYSVLRPPAKGKKSGPAQVRALQCLLKKRGVYKGAVNGSYNPKLVASVKAWEQRVGLPLTTKWSRKAWQTLHASGSTKVLKIGSTGMPVRRVQRALNAKPGTNGPVDGVYGAATQAAVSAWQTTVGLEVNGVFGGDDWAYLQAGKR